MGNVLELEGGGQQKKEMQNTRAKGGKNGSIVLCINHAAARENYGNVS